MPVGITSLSLHILEIPRKHPPYLVASFRAAIGRETRHPSSSTRGQSLLIPEIWIIFAIAGSAERTIDTWCANHGIHEHKKKSLVYVRVPIRIPTPVLIRVSSDASWHSSHGVVLLSLFLFLRPFLLEFMFAMCLPAPTAHCPLPRVFHISSSLQQPPLYPTITWLSHQPSSSFPSAGLPDPPPRPSTILKLIQLPSNNKPADAHVIPRNLSPERAVTLDPNPCALISATNSNARTVAMIEAMLTLSELS